MCYSSEVVRELIESTIVGRRETTSCEKFVSDICNETSMYMICWFLNCEHGPYA